MNSSEAFKPEREDLHQQILLQQSLVNMSSHHHPSGAHEQSSGVYQMVNDSTIMKKIDAQQQNESREGQLRQCQDFADIVSIVSQESKHGASKHTAAKNQPSIASIRNDFGQMSMNDQRRIQAQDQLQSEKTKHSTQNDNSHANYNLNYFKNLGSEVNLKQVDKSQFDQKSQAIRASSQVQNSHVVPQFKNGQVTKRESMPLNLTKSQQALNGIVSNGLKSSRSGIKQSVHNFIERQNYSKHNFVQSNGQNTHRNNKMYPTILSNANGGTSSQAKLTSNNHSYNTPGCSSKQNKDGSYQASNNHKQDGSHQQRIMNGKSHGRDYNNLQIYSPKEDLQRLNVTSGLQTTKHTTASNLICSPKQFTKSNSKMASSNQQDLRKNMSNAKIPSRNYQIDLKTTTSQQQNTYSSHLQYHQKYKGEENFKAAQKATQIHQSKSNQKSQGSQSQSKTNMQQYSSNTQKLSGLVSSSLKAGNLDHSYFQNLVQQHQQVSPKAHGGNINQTQKQMLSEHSVSSPQPNQSSRAMHGYGQVFSPASKSLNNTAYAQVKAQQQKIKNDHVQNRDKMRKETIDKTIETINHMKTQNQDNLNQFSDRKVSALEKTRATQAQKESFNSTQVTQRAKSGGNTSHNFKPSQSRLHLTNQPLVSTRGQNQASQPSHRFNHDTVQSARRDKHSKMSSSYQRQDHGKQYPSKQVADSSNNQIYSGYKNFIDKQRKIVSQLSQSKLQERAESILETITENRPGVTKNTVAATPRAADPRKTALIVTNQHSNSKPTANEIDRRKSSGIQTHRKDFISENKKLSSGIYQPTSANKTKAQCTIVSQRKSSSQAGVGLNTQKRDQQRQSKLNQTLNQQAQLNQKTTSNRTPRGQNIVNANDKSPAKSSAFSFFNGQQTFGVNNIQQNSSKKAASKFSQKPNLNMTQTYTRSNLGNKNMTHRDEGPQTCATPRNMFDKTHSSGKVNARKGSSYSNYGHKSFVSSKGTQPLGGKMAASKSALQQYNEQLKEDQTPNYTQGKTEDFVKNLQVQNQMLQNTAAELLTFAAGTKAAQSLNKENSKKSSDKKPEIQEQGIDQLVLTQQLLLAPRPPMKSDVANMLVNSKQKIGHQQEQVNTPPSSAGAPAVFLSSSQIKRDEEARESTLPKPFNADSNRKNSKTQSPNKKKQDKENIVTQVVKSESPRDQDVLQQINQHNVQKEVKQTVETQKEPSPAELNQANNNQQQAQSKTAQSNPADDTMVFSEKSSLDDYIIGKQIGQGAYAVVRIGLHKPTNQKVAMKIYKKYKLEEPNRRKSVKREIKLMEKMRHQHIIQLYEIIDTQKYVILVMEYIGGGSLHGYLKSKPNRRLEENDAKRIFREIVESLKYCHSRCITHRDIKLENVLLDDHGTIKMIDFGFSTCIPNDKKIKIFCGTPSYMAPEIVTKSEYCGPPADIWALGVLLFTCLSGQFPYRGATDEELYDKICRSDYNLPSQVKESLSVEAINLLSLLFKLKAEERPSAKELLQHPWFSHYSSQGSSDLQHLQIQKRAKSQNQTAAANTHRATNYQTKQEFVAPPKVTAKDLQFNPFSGQMQAPITEQRISSNLQNPSQAQPLQIDPQIQIQQLGRSNSHVIGKQSQTQKHMSRKQLIFSGEQKSPRSENINHSIVKIIVDKLGYTQDEVMRYLLSQKEQNSFVSNLYQRLLEEEKKRGVSPNKANMVSQQSLGENAFSGSGYSLGFGQGNQQQNLGVKPSYVPSIKSLTSATGAGSYMNLSNNLKSNTFNNTQPLSNKYLNNTADSNSAISPKNLNENLRLAQTFSSSSRSGNGGHHSYFNQTGQNTYRGSSTPQGANKPKQQFNNFFSNTGDQTQHLEQLKVGESNIINMSQESPDFNKQAALQNECGPQAFYGHESELPHSYRQTGYTLVNEKNPSTRY